MGNTCTHFNEENIEDTMNCMWYVYGMNSNYSPTNVDYSTTSIKAATASKSIPASSPAKTKSN